MVRKNCAARIARKVALSTSEWKKRSLSEMASAGMIGLDAQYVVLAMGRGGECGEGKTTQLGWGGKMVWRRDGKEAQKPTSINQNF